jgi:hypothetical protein
MQDHGAIESPRLDRRRDRRRRCRGKCGDKAASLITRFFTLAKAPQ